jgi:hypothetical protein
MVDAPYKIQTPSAAKQFGVALFFGAIAATITYQVTTRMAEPDKQVTDGGYKFVFFMSALAGGAVFIIASKIYKAWADKKYRESLGPPTARKLPD